MDEVSGDLQQTVAENNPDTWSKLRTARRTVSLDEGTVPQVEVELAKGVSCFNIELMQARRQTMADVAQIKHSLPREVLSQSKGTFNTYINEQIIPDDGLDDGFGSSKPYDKGHHTATAIQQDVQLSVVKAWLENLFERPVGLTDKQYKAFMKKARKFFVDSKGRLYRKSTDARHKLVIDKERRMYMMSASHDKLGH